MTEMRHATGLSAATVEIAPQLHYIDGTFRPGVAGRTFETTSPITNLPIADVAEGLAADVDLAVTAARHAFDEGPWPRMKPAERAVVLRRIAGRSASTPTTSSTSRSSTSACPCGRCAGWPSGQRRTSTTSPAS